MTNIIGFVGMDDKAPEFTEGRPYFCSRDITGIKNRILEVIYEKINRTKLFGLILTGGMSSRMNREKCLLSYHGVSQIDYCHDLLSGSCEKVFVSSRREQVLKGYNSDIPKILDRFLGWFYSLLKLYRLDRLQPVLPSLYPPGIGPVGRTMHE